ncbi:MAG: metallophosphoesterase [Candidatus Azobacteroides sp.]|nr:metallophosphoesterase [Candidatus Azobacteroides sp.]
MRSPFIMLLVIVVFLGANCYVFYRIWNMIPANPVGRILLIVFAVVAMVSPFVAILAGERLPSAVTSVLYQIGTSWIFIWMYLLILFLLFDLIRVTGLFPINKIMYGNPVVLLVLTVILAAVFTGGYFNYLNKKRVELSVSVNKELTAPLKIVAISDLHLGYGIGKKELNDWIALINKENPDVVLIAGDIIDNNVKPLYEQEMEQDFHKIKSKYGVYTVLGNHEYIAGVSKSVRFLHDAGITLLRDSCVLVGGVFYLAGRDDRSNPKRKPLQELITLSDRSKPLIMLDHQPFHLEEIEKNNIDLQVSGHTHYGQIFPISWITRLIYEDAYGYLKKGNSTIYVSSGIGTWGGKFRIGTRSEYVMITVNGKQVDK